MPFVERGPVRIYYEEYGSGYPVLLIAPGGMRSTIDFWERISVNPKVDLASDFRVIAMDQRNAGQSSAPVTVADNWLTYNADQLALMDRLGHRRFHVVGCCIGCSYALSMISIAPERVSAAGMLQPIGLAPGGENVFFEMFNGWAAELKQQRPEIDQKALDAFRANMYGGDFVFSVSRDFVRNCRTPMLVMAGNDQYHPLPISEEVAKLAPNTEFIREWKTPEAAATAASRLRAFLKEHQGA